jgi:hypothetical protein
MRSQLDQNFLGILPQHWSHPDRVSYGGPQQKSAAPERTILGQQLETPTARGRTPQKLKHFFTSKI